MHLLDDDGRRRRVDTDDVLRAFTLLPEQAREAWVESTRLRLPDYSKVRRIVVAGMGGSALGPHVALSVFRDRLRMPLEIVNDYALPGGVDKNTLVVLSSYSGTTEETLAAAKEAVRRKAKLLGIASGGPLALFLHRQKAPSYLFSPRANPGNRPRMALGYLLFGFLGLMAGGKVLTGVQKEVEQAIGVLRKAVRAYGFDVPLSKNPAKKLALVLKEKAPFYVAAEHLEGSAHVLANQTNETGKQFASWFPIPNLNHHLMEGLVHPPSVRRGLHMVFLSSGLYSKRIQKRFLLTGDVVKKNGVTSSTWQSRETSRLGQAAELLAFGGALTYFLGILHGENPAPTPWVDYFKARLGATKS